MKELYQALLKRIKNEHVMVPAFDEIERLIGESKNQELPEDLKTKLENLGKIVEGARDGLYCREEVAKAIEAVINLL